ncbi:MAG TPA: biliverdin-producing heme oxygenase, partial [Thermoanaerobaculia bacterium]|nr:biliverdin-producing heme oxygenase [Thermoanaerobaculia bacterium]
LRKSSWLENDLGSLPEPRVIARVADQAEAWGALYVLEGATLGASAIERIIPGGTARYLEGYGAETRTMWAAMQAALDEEVAGEAQDACVRGAQRVFSHFEEALAHHG